MTDTEMLLAVIYAVNKLILVQPIRGRDSVGLNKEASFCESHDEDIVILDPPHGSRESIVKGV